MPSCFANQERIKSLERGAEQVDAAIAEALRRRRPVLIEVAANLAAMSHASLAPSPVPGALQPKISNWWAWFAAVLLWRLCLQSSAPFARQTADASSHDRPVLQYSRRICL